MKKNYLFLSFALPDIVMNPVFKIDKFPAVQTHKFIWNLIKAIESTENLNCTYISCRPVSDYPYYPYKNIKMHEWITNVREKQIRITEIPSSNLPIFKIITRFIFGLYYSVKKYHKVENKDGIMVYSVHVPFLIIGYVISRVYKIPFIAIWTDPPAIRYSRDSFLKSLLRKVEFKISKFFMDRVSKVIALTKYLAHDFAPNKPSLIVEGIIDEDESIMNVYKEKRIKSSLIKVVYTGSLEKRYGIKNIIDSFQMMNDEKLQLEIYGRGDFEDELKEVSTKNKSIKYKGFLPNEEILKIQREADFLINARPVDDLYVKYSFPSKTLEYMLSGTPLITTMLPGIPEEYEDYIIKLKDNSVEEISKKLNQIKNLTKSEKYELGVKAQNYALRKRFSIQGKRILNFINSE